MHHKLSRELDVDQLQPCGHPEPLVEEEVGLGGGQDQFVKEEILEEEKHDEGVINDEHNSYVYGTKEG